MCLADALYVTALAIQWRRAHGEYSHNLLYECIARRTAIVPENNDANDYTTPEQTKTFAGGVLPSNHANNHDCQDGNDGINNTSAAIR
jgi:hypothetical protein